MLLQQKVNNHLSIPKSKRKIQKKKTRRTISQRRRKRRRKTRRVLLCFLQLKTQWTSLMTWMSSNKRKTEKSTQIAAAVFAIVLMNLLKTKFAAVSFP
jgi:hypothetical protein